MPKRFLRGFTLVELLVVISIIAILAAVGMVSYQNVSKNVRDAKRKADIDAISKAYETKYNFKTQAYPSLAASDFAASIIPAPPENPTGSYDYVKGPDSLDKNTDSFRVCAKLEGRSTTCSSNAENGCFCKDSTNGTVSGVVASCAVSTINLVGHWKMDDGSGNTVTNSINSSNNGTLSGGSLPTWTTNGKFGKALFFNGNGYVDVLNSENLGNGNAMTVSVWIKRSDLISSGEGYIVGKWGSDWILLVSGSWRPEWVVNPIPNLYPATSISETTTWHHIVGTFSNSGYSDDPKTDTIRIYVDGIKANSSTTAFSFSTTPRINFGRNTTANNSFFKGYMDDVRIYNRALSLDEVNSLYNSGSGCVQ